MPGLLEDLSTDIRTFLIAQGVVREPRTAGSAPPLWIDPREGTPAPNEAQNATEKGDPVIGLYQTGGVPSQPFESSLREDIFDFRIRASTGYKARQAGRQLRDALIDRRQIQMGSQTVIDCEEWRPLQRLTSDEQGFDYVWAIRVQSYTTRS